MSRRWSVSAPVTVTPKGDVAFSRKVDGLVMRYDKPEDHPAYNDALRAAARRAWDSRHEGYMKDGFYPPCFTVYFDGVSLFVRRAKDECPPKSKAVCIAQYFSGKGVQLRFDGARSEWIEFDK